MSGFAEAGGEIAGLEIVGHDLSAVGDDVSAGVRLAGGELEALRSVLRWGEGVGALDFQAVDDVARAFGDGEADVDVTAAVVDRGDYLDAAESFRLVHALEVSDALT